MRSLWSATQRSRSADLWQNEVEPTYSVPRDSPLDITLDGQRLTGMEPSEVLITGGNGSDSPISGLLGMQLLEYIQEKKDDKGEKK